MNIDRNTLLFFDAACVIAAAGSPNGGSGFLLHLCRRGLLRGAISPIVLWEAETNIVAKLPSALVNFQHLVTTTPFVIAPTPSSSDIHHYQALVNHKDAHVIAAAMNAKASFLLTLDQSFLREVQAARLKLHGLTPGAFITGLLPSHPDAAQLRD